MRIRTLTTGIITAIGLVLGVGLTAGPAASAAWAGTHQAAARAAAQDPHQICSISGGAPDQCLNNWNDAYGDVLSYAPNAANNSFIVEGVDRCGNGDYTTSGCPVAGVPANLFVYQIAYGNNASKCIATNSVSVAVSGTCNGSNGYGGSAGTLEIAYHDGCPSGTNTAINVYWTGQEGGWGHAAGIWFGSSNGSSVVLGEFLGNGDLPCLGYYSY
jgi:hypothetical protein